MAASLAAFVLAVLNRRLKRERRSLKEHISVLQLANNKLQYDINIGSNPPSERKSVEAISTQPQAKVLSPDHQDAPAQDEEDHSKSKFYLKSSLSQKGSASHIEGLQDERYKEPPKQAKPKKRPTLPRSREEEEEEGLIEEYATCRTGQPTSGIGFTVPSAVYVEMRACADPIQQRTKQQNTTDSDSQPNDTSQRLPKPHEYDVPEMYEARERLHGAD